MNKQVVIMLKSLDDVGEIGDTVAVSRGYARNYLIPGGYALPDSRYAQNLVKSRHKTIEHTRVQEKASAEEQKVLIEKEPCHIEMRASDTGKLFGSVTASAIVDELAKRSVHIGTRAIKIPHGKINAIGEHSIPIHLYAEVVATLSLQIEARNE